LQADYSPETRPPATELTAFQPEAPRAADSLQPFAAPVTAPFNRSGRVSAEASFGQMPPPPDRVQPFMTPLDNGRAQEVFDMPRNLTDAHVPNTNQYAEAHVRPGFVMEQVAEAAEHDVPVEMAYERRQEIKDESGQAGHSGGAGAASTPQQQPNPFFAPSGQPPQASARQLAETQAYLSTNSSGSTNGDMYKHAMQRGFWSAIVILVLGAVAYLLLR
jgi:hypothetical protein